VSNDATAVGEIAVVADGDSPRTVLHYLYAPSSEAAAVIAGELRQRGFLTEERIGGDGVNYLVLARHEAVPTDQLMTSTRRFMEALVATVGGEYDGWEADVRHRDSGCASPH
jgi:Regulator of ribonuclease activity B